MGGWPNEEMVKHFENFARLAYQRFGDRVKTWVFDSLFK
jgi:beta-glucosidase/6-phospho-beta-glucosidase/beta-galactosidase